MLETNINDGVSDAKGAVVRIRKLKEQANARAEKSSNPAVRKAVESFTARLTDIEGEIYQHRNQSNQDPLNYPIRLNNKLAALQRTVESGDARPTDQSYAVFKELSGHLDKQLARLDAFVSTELPALNKLLAEHQLEPIEDDSSGTR